MKYKTKKEVIEFLISNGFAERHSADPEGGFYGKQTWIEVTPCGHEADVLIHRASSDCGPGEVGPIDYISIAGKCLWTEPDGYFVMRDGKYWTGTTVTKGIFIDKISDDYCWTCQSAAQEVADKIGGYVLPFYAD